MHYLGGDVTAGHLTAPLLINDEDMMGFFIKIY